MLARPGLPSFRYIRTTSATQVHQVLQEGDARLMMGGTDLFPQMRDGAVRPSIVVDVKDQGFSSAIRIDSRSRSRFLMRAN